MADLLSLHSSLEAQGRRRQMLRGAMLGVPVALGMPRLEAMLDGHGEAYADGTALPSCMGVWVFGTGVQDGWMPKQTGALVLPNGFTPLSRHLSRVSMISRMRARNAAA